MNKAETVALDAVARGEKVVIAVDFDGVLCENAFGTTGEIGEPITEIIEELKRVQSLGHILVLWTCREDLYKKLCGVTVDFWDLLNEAILWCKKRGLRFPHVNRKEGAGFEEWEGERRKVSADIYIDDKSVGFSREKVIEFLKEIQC